VDQLNRAAADAVAIDEPAILMMEQHLEDSLIRRRGSNRATFP
jgi:hypothetical protein